jgi:hypothetical protein
MQNCKNQHFKKIKIKKRRARARMKEKKRARLGGGSMVI